MAEVFQSIVRISKPFNMIVLIALFVAVSGVLGTVVKHARKYASHRHKLDLKRDILDRGMSVDEIERAIKVQSRDSDS